MSLRGIRLRMTTIECLWGNKEIGKIVSRGRREEDDDDDDDDDDNDDDDDDLSDCFLSNLKFSLSLEA